MFVLLKRASNISLPMDIMLKRVNVFGKPVVLYGAKDSSLIFFKYVLSVNKFTSSIMVDGELSATPLDVDIESRILTFWARL